MRLSQFCASIVSLFLLFPFTANALDTAAQQAFLIDAQTHAVLLNKDGDVAMHPSSMSKLMTLYVLFSHLKEGRIKLSDQLPVSEKAWRTEGSKTFVKVGDTISIENLIHGIIIQSGNDACVVLAEGISGSEEAFVAEMNEAAKKLGLTQSRFANATGLPDENHLMSARDLATLAEHLINDFPEFYPNFALREFTYSNITQSNRNRLLARNIGVDGLKTGHTEQAGYGIVLSAKQNDRRVILVVNGLESDNARIEEGDKLLRWAFREFVNVPLVKKGAVVANAKVWMGTASEVPLTVADDVLATLPAAAAKDAKFTLKYNGPVAAPIAAGAKIAELSVEVAGQEPRIIPLLAASDVGKAHGLSKLKAVFDYYVLRKR